MKKYIDRYEAGIVLANLLKDYANQEHAITLAASIDGNTQPLLHYEQKKIKL